MADNIKLREISDTELDNKLHEHLIWLNTDGEHGTRADLTMYDLSHRCFPNVNFTKAICHMTNFAYSDLTCAVFEESNLTCADFRNATLRNTNFNGAKLAFADFDNATMDEYCLETLEVPKVDGGLYKMPGDYPKY